MPRRLLLPQPMAQAMLSGKRSLEEISERVLREGIDPKPRSGKQEILENIVNRYI